MEEKLKEEKSVNEESSFSNVKEYLQKIFSFPSFHFRKVISDDDKEKLFKIFCSKFVPSRLREKYKISILITPLIIANYCISHYGEDPLKEKESENSQSKLQFKSICVDIIDEISSNPYTYKLFSYIITEENPHLSDKKLSTIFHIIYDKILGEEMKNEAAKFMNGLRED